MFLLEMRMIVYVIMTGPPSRGGDVYSVCESEAEAHKEWSGLQPDSYIMPWKLGSRKWDDDWIKFTYNFLERKTNETKYE
jgi:hypothetical protein